ncbi:hypothetical protein D3C81_1970120 [compost metagenome]
MRGWSMAGPCLWGAPLLFQRPVEFAQLRTCLKSAAEPIFVATIAFIQSEQCVTHFCRVLKRRFAMSREDLFGDLFADGL